MLPLKSTPILKKVNMSSWCKTRNYLGEIITSQPMYLTVKPPFYRSLLAKLIYLILGISVLSLVYLHQNRRYKRKATKIEEAKQHELEEKQKKLIEVEQQKEQELLQLEDDKMKSELRHLNNLLAASTMNLVVKNEFIEAIKEKLKVVNRKGKNKDTQQSLLQIVKEIDTTLRLQEDWEQFEYHFDQVHGDFLIRLRDEFVELTPNEQNSARFCDSI